MNAYELKQEMRRSRLEARAERLRKLSSARYQTAKGMMDCIPMGQPILVGHHSEKRDRNFRKRIDSNMRASFELNKAAEEAAGRAASVGSGGISSDDPDAVVKLKGELASLEANQRQWKEISAAWRKAGKPAADNTAGWQTIADAVGMNINDLTKVRSGMAVDSLRRGPVPGYMLSNNNANIRRLKARIEHLTRQAKATPEEVEIGGVKVLGVPDENRVRIIFPGKPGPDARTKLKQNGWRWAPSEGAWQRHYSTSALYWAKRLVGEITGQPVA